MTAHSQIAAAPILQRAFGLLNFSAQRKSNDVTRLKSLRQQGSYRAVFPRPIDGNVEAVIVNTAGGITGGDKFMTTVTAHENANVSLTTQAAERIYCAPTSQVGSVQTKLNAKQGSQLFWLPQETILFDGAKLKRSLEVKLEAGAKFLMVEPLVFGREASGEAVRSACLDDRVSIILDHHQIYLDRVKLEGDIANHLASPAIAHGARAMANIVLANRNAKSLLDPVRTLLSASAGASLLTDDVLVVRILATDSYALRKTIFPILTLLTDDAVPKNWRL